MTWRLKHRVARPKQRFDSHTHHRFALSLLALPLYLLSRMLRLRCLSQEASLAARQRVLEQQERGLMTRHRELDDQALGDRAASRAVDRQQGESEQQRPAVEPSVHGINSRTLIDDQ